MTFFLLFAVAGFVKDKIEKYKDTYKPKNFTNSLGVWF